MTFPTTKQEAQAQGYVPCGSGVARVAWASPCGQYVFKHSPQPPDPNSQQAQEQALYSLLAETITGLKREYGAGPGVFGLAQACLPNVYQWGPDYVLQEYVSVGTLGRLSPDPYIKQLFQRCGVTLTDLHSANYGTPPGDPGETLILDVGFYGLYPHAARTSFTQHALRCQQAADGNLPCPGPHRRSPLTAAPR